MGPFAANASSHQNVRGIWRHPIPKFMGGPIDQALSYGSCWAGRYSWSWDAPRKLPSTPVIDNVVVTCAGCNFGRMDHTLAELGLLDPREQAIEVSDWDGLEQILTE
jgi:hypothetical protein